MKELFWSILAVDPNAVGGGGDGKGSLKDMLIPLGLVFVVMWFFMFRGPKKRQKQQQQILNAIKKNDRIRTIGGIIGTVVEVKDDELVLKIDENTNTKMRITRSAVGKVITDEDEQKK